MVVDKNILGLSAFELLYMSLNNRYVQFFSQVFLVIDAGVESRGFIFGPPIALAIGAKFIPLRKPNKLPGTIIY